MARPLALILLFLLAGCGPRLEGELIAGRTVMVTNRDDEPLTIVRVIANGAGGRSECIDEAATNLAPGRSYTTTFFLCEEVAEVDIETDRGTKELNLR